MMIEVNYVQDWQIWEFGALAPRTSPAHIRVDTMQYVCFAYCDAWFITDKVGRTVSWGYCKTMLQGLSKIKHHLSVRGLHNA